MALSRRIGRSRFTLVLLVLTSITLITLDFRGFGPLETARSAVLSAFAPVGDATTAVFRPVGNLWHGAFQYDDLKKQNEQLQQQVDQLNGQITDGEVAQRSNEQLLELLGLPRTNDLTTTPARVVSGPIANFDDTIEIDKGESAGVRKGMPVRTGTGLVGTVVQTSSDRAVIKLITDTSFQVGFTVVGSPIRGVARGRGADRQLEGTVDTSRRGEPGADPGHRGPLGGQVPARHPHRHGGPGLHRHRGAGQDPRHRPAGPAPQPHLRRRGAVGAQLVSTRGSAPDGTRPVRARFAAPGVLGARR